MPEMQRYDSRTILLHWIMAGLLAVTWLIPKLSGYLSQAARVYPRSVHIVIGVTLLALLLARIIWRATGGRHLPSAQTGPIGWAARAVHYALYAMVAAALLFGVAYELMRGDNMFNLGSLPALIATDPATRRQFRGFHELAANGVLILAALHASAALFHHYVVKDSVLRRMLKPA